MTQVKIQRALSGIRLSQKAPEEQNQNIQAMDQARDPVIICHQVVRLTT